MFRFKPFRDWSIRRKLTGLFVAMAGITAVAVSVAIGAFDLFGLEQSMGRNLSILANVLGQNSAAALTFQDLRRPPRPRCVAGGTKRHGGLHLHESGNPFATYVRRGGKAGFAPPPMHAPWTTFDPDASFVFRSIDFSGEKIGTIYIESDLEPLRLACACTV